MQPAFMPSAILTCGSFHQYYANCKLSSHTCLPQVDLAPLLNREHECFMLVQWMWIDYLGLSVKLRIVASNFDFLKGLKYLSSCIPDPACMLVLQSSNKDHVCITLHPVLVFKI